MIVVADRPPFQRVISSSVCGSTRHVNGMAPVLLYWPALLCRSAWTCSKVRFGQETRRWTLFPSSSFRLVGVRARVLLLHRLLEATERENLHRVLLAELDVLLVPEHRTVHPPARASEEAVAVDDDGHVQETRLLDRRVQLVANVTVGLILSAANAAPERSVTASATRASLMSTS
jgi:hypothetical protein